MAQGEFIEILSSDALASLKTANDEVTKLISNINKAGESMKAIKTPSRSDSAIKELNDNYREQEKIIKSLQTQLTALAKAKQTVNQKTSEEIVNQRALAQSSDKQAQSVSKLVGEYKRIEAEVFKLTQTYNNLAIKQQLGQTLTSKEVATLELAQKELIKYNTALKNVDAGIGKYSRNVGNYEGATRNLQFSLAQISRELPNFGQSIQIGILSLTNNIGFLQDSLRQVKEQNAVLKAEGKQTQNVYKLIASSIFSFNTALYVGIGLFSAYRQEIQQWVSSLWDGDRALKTLNESQKKLNNSRLEGSINAIKDKTELKALLEVAKDERLTNLERQSAIDKVRTSYGFYFREISNGELLEGKYGDALRRTNQALDARERSNAIKVITDENRGKIMQLEIERDLISVTERRVNPKAYKQYEAIQKEIILLQQQNIKWELESVRLKKLSQGLDVKIKDDQKKNIEDKVNNAKKYYEQINVFTEQWFNSEISRLEDVRRKLADNTKEYASYTNEINVLKQLLLSLQGLEVKDTLLKDQLEALDEGIKKMKSFEENTTKTKEETDKLRKSTDEWIKSFQDGFFADAGLPTLLKVLNGEIKGFGKNFTETFLAISQISQEALEFMTQSSNAYFENQQYQLGQQRDVAIAFAGESATAREEIERQYDQRQRQLKRQQAKEQQKIALFNIAIDTAQAIVASFKKDPTGFLAGIIGAIGILQASIVASTPIPEFYKGTENAPEGWAYTQEKGAEIITDKNGKVKSLGSNKGAELTYLNKGDKVFTAQESQMMFNNDLNNILVGNGIMMPKVEVNIGTEILGSKIDNLTRTIANKESFTIVENDRGRKVYQRKQAETKELLNNVLTIKGYEV